jgi:hypothetical protein
VTALNVKGQLTWAPAAAEVMQVLGAGSDIMAFTETWRREGSLAPEIAGYTGYNFARPRRLQSNADGPPRGGIAIYFRDNIAQHVSRGVSEIDTDPSNSLAVLRISRAVGFEKDLYLIVTYINPKAPQSIWNLLEEWVTTLSARGLVLVVGDQNARTREDADFPVAGPAEGDGDLNAVPTCLVRRNQDPRLNASGSKMLAICQRTGLRIANGRVAGDKEGALTFRSVVPNGGASAVDNVLACPFMFPLITCLQVKPAAFSDHSAVSVQLTLGQGSTCQTGQCQGVPAPRAQRMAGAANIKAWVEDILPGIADQFARIAGEAPLAAARGADNLHMLCQEFDKLCAESFPKQLAETTRVQQPRWFDAELAQGRRAAQAAMRRNPGSSIARQLQREYQRKLKRKQRGFKRSQGIALASRVRDNPKAFWQKYKTRKPVPASITKEQWSSHFSKLLGEVPAPAAAQQGRARSNNVTVAQKSADGSGLNAPFTADDIGHCISGLRKGAATLGFLSVDALREAAPQLASSLAALLNGCSAVGALPTTWALSALTPVFKSGETSDPGNYRGIAVGTVGAKLYASMINSRLSAWAEEKGLRAQGQAGFREDHRCSDHLLALRTLIEQQRVKKKRLYACFVDFTKAYDTIPRDLLWQKLESLGVRGWFLDTIKSLYGAVPMAVKTAQGLTATFESVMGVKQGCPLSPTLFGLYIDDFEQVLAAHQLMLDLPSLSGRRIPALLYADDLALVSTSAKGLQAQLDVLQAYATKWRLTVNIGKTKAVIFSARKSQVDSLPLVYAGANIEVVESFRYLGLDLHCTKALDTAGSARSEAAGRSEWALSGRCSELGIEEPALKLHLWDALVKQSMLYGVEVWGDKELNAKVDIAGEMVHKAFVRRLLGVPSGTPNMAVLAEVGRYPLSVAAATVMLKYWNRLVEMDDGRLVKQAFLQSAALARALAPNSLIKPWAGQVASFLASLNLPHDLNAPQSVDILVAVEKLQCRYVTSVTASNSYKVQQYLQLRSGVDTASYTPAAYLQAVGGWRQRQAVAQLRTGSSWLAVETGRHQGAARVQRAARVCQRCSSSAIDDVEHMVFDCSALETHRWDHPSLFVRRSRSVSDFMAQDPTELAAFVYECKKSCLAAG